MPIKGMLQRNLAIGVALVYMGVVGPLQAQSVYVRLNHWAYDFVERLEAKGLIHGALNGTKPYSREEMTSYLLQVEEKVRGGLVLSKTETQQLQFLRFEFKEEFEHITGSNGHHYVSRLQRIKENSVVGRAFPGFVYKNNRNFFSVREPGFKLFADPVFYHKFEYANPDSIASTDRVFERTHGFQLWGQLGSHMGFFFDFRDTKEWGSRAYPSRFDISREGFGFVNGYGTHIWHDETVAYLVFKLPYIQLMLGKDSNYWGPGFNGACPIFHDCMDQSSDFDRVCCWCEGHDRINSFSCLQNLQYCVRIVCDCRRMFIES